MLVFTRTWGRPLLPVTRDYEVPDLAVKFRTWDFSFKSGRNGLYCGMLVCGKTMVPRARSEVLGGLQNMHVGVHGVNCLLSQVFECYHVYYVVFSGASCSRLPFLPCLFGVFLWSRRALSNV